MGERPVILESLQEKVQRGRVALLLIDMVNDFVSPDGKTAVIAKRPIGHARSVIPTQQTLLAAARAAGIAVIHVQHTTLRNHDSDSGPWLDARSRATYSVEDICLESTWGQEIIPELLPQENERVVQKYRYSGFAGTNLDLILRTHRVQTVICCGVSTNACVESTARDAFSLDYYVVIPHDACASWDRSLHEATIQSARARYATVCTSEDIIQAWGGDSGHQE